MFNVLLETNRVRPPRPVVETAMSAAVHAGIIALIIGGSAVATNKQVQDRVEGILQFLFPPDRAKSPGVESTAYVALADRGSEKGESRGEPVQVKRDATAGDPVVPKQSAEAAKLDGIMQLAEAAQAVGAFSIVDVDSAAERDPLSAAPSYPRDLLTKNIEGYATMRFVVDSTGLIDLSTIKLIEATNPLFARAVEDAMPKMRFRPAVNGGHAVRQLAEQLFKFEIRKPPPIAKPE